MVWWAVAAALLENQIKKNIGKTIKGEEITPESQTLSFGDIMNASKEGSDETEHPRDYVALNTAEAPQVQTPEDTPTNALKSFLKGMGHAAVRYDERKHDNVWEAAGEVLPDLAYSRAGLSEPTPMSNAEKANELQARSSMDAFLKYQRGEPLSSVEQQVVGGANTPNQWDVWKEARQEVMQNLGGSSWMALSPEAQKQYYPQINERYLELLKKFNIETPETKLERAKIHLKKNGYMANNETASTWLKNNPNF